MHSTLQIVVKNIDSGVTYNISVEFLRVLSRGSSVHRVISTWTLPKAKGKGSGYLLGTVSWAGISDVDLWVLPYVCCFMFQVRNLSSVSLRVVTGDSPTLVIVRSTAMCTPVTSHTIVKSGVVISRTRIHPVLGSIWRYVNYIVHIVVAIFIWVCMKKNISASLDRLSTITLCYYNSARSFRNHSKALQGQTWNDFILLL